MVVRTGPTVASVDVIASSTLCHPERVACLLRLSLSNCNEQRVPNRTVTSAASSGALLNASAQTDAGGSYGYPGYLVQITANRDPRGR